MPNPFSYAEPVPPSRLIGRQRELRYVSSRIVNGGQSTSIVGEPLTGKTSMLLYLVDREKREELYGPGHENLIFSYLDAQSLREECNQAEFWELSLRPALLWSAFSDPGSPLGKAYGSCRDRGFDTYSLDSLLMQVEAQSLRVVLLLDGFDELLYHSALNCAEFLASLAALASRNKALALIIASRSSLKTPKKGVQQSSRTGFPYFSFLAEKTLGPFLDNEVQLLLQMAGERFTADDRDFIRAISGNQPYLVQVAASLLWEEREGGGAEPARQCQSLWHSFFDEVAPVLDNTWQLWSPARRRAFAAVALVHINSFEGREFHVDRLVRDMRDFGPELRSLEKTGYLREEKDSPLGWTVRPSVFLQWIADELVRAVRHEVSFEEWLQKQELEGFLTRNERQQLGKALRTTMSLLQGGADPLIKLVSKR